MYARYIYTLCTYEILFAYVFMVCMYVILGFFFMYDIDVRGVSYALMYVMYVGMLRMYVMCGCALCMYVVCVGVVCALCLSVRCVYFVVYVF